MKSNDKNKRRSGIRYIFYLLYQIYGVIVIYCVIRWFKRVG